MKKMRSQIERQKKQLCGNRAMAEMKNDIGAGLNRNDTFLMKNKVTEIML